MNRTTRFAISLGSATHSRPVMAARSSMVWSLSRNFVSASVSAMASALILAMILVPVGSLLVVGVTRVASADAALLNAQCSACHQRDASGGLARIHQVRKPAEAWDMTIVRMMQFHGVQVSGADRATLVKYLADTQGLAPSETADYRYILEREPSAIENPPDELTAAMCGRCHSYARVGLQRRDEAEWLKLSHFHMGQWPTIEYQALARDRNWWEIATTAVPKKLSELFPYSTDAWDKWMKQSRTDVSGVWRVVGHRPGHGSYQGIMEVEASGDDQYKVTMGLTYDNGVTVSGKGQAIVYTGFEWRASVKLGDESIRQVFALAEDGNGLSGRWFLSDSDALGAAADATRVTERSEVLSTAPNYLRAGTTATIAIHGVNLDGDVSLGEGVEVLRVVSRDANSVMVDVRAAEVAAVGTRQITVGGALAPGLLTVYQKVDSVRVEPEYTIARVGDAGGPLPAVPAQFDAVAFANGSDGEAGTDDDLRIGVMKAQWKVENFDEIAQTMNDAQFAGKMMTGGLFNPAGAGLNAQRPFSTNNAGNLSVIATVTDGANQVTGTGRLLVTVQRWNDPPIR